VSSLEIIEDQKVELIKKDHLINEQSEHIKQLKFQNDQLLRLIYGSKSERFISTIEDPSQLHLFGEQEDPTKLEEQTEHISYDRKKSTKKHPGRHEIPDHLPVIEQVIEPEENTEGLIRIGEEVSESLDYTPASLVKRRIIRPKYADKQKDSIYIAAMPERFMNKGIAEPGLLSHMVVSKYVDHLPLYRQAKQLAREFDFHVSASTMNNWMSYVCDRLEPIYDSLQKQVLASSYIQVDESPLTVLERKIRKTGKSPPDSKKRMIGYQWVYMSPEQKTVYFNYRKGRGMHGPKEILEGYQGYVQSDGYAVYDKIARQNQAIKSIGCLAHARRKFYEAKDSDNKRSEYAMSIFNKIYQLDGEYKREDLTVKDTRFKLRQEKIKPLFEQLLNWIQKESEVVLPKSPIGKAMNYFQSQYPKLSGCLEQGNLHLDNNWVENKIRPLALGRKNYLFAGSHKGARWIAMMYSFFGTCYMNDINPRTWLQESMVYMTTHKIEDYSILIPGNMEE
jgi:transposase